MYQLFGAGFSLGAPDGLRPVPGSRPLEENERPGVWTSTVGSWVLKRGQILVVGFLWFAWKPSKKELLLFLWVFERFLKRRTPFSFGFPGKPIQRGILQTRERRASDWAYIYIYIYSLATAVALLATVLLRVVQNPSSCQPAGIPFVWSSQDFQVLGTGPRCFD